MPVLLQVPPALNRFTRTLDKNMAETLFKLLMKYRPEDKAAKKERLLKEAQAREAGAYQAAAADRCAPHACRAPAPAAPRALLFPCSAQPFGAGRIPCAAAAPHDPRTHLPAARAPLPAYRPGG